MGREEIMYKEKIKKLKFDLLFIFKFFILFFIVGPHKTKKKTKETRKTASSHCVFVVL